MSGNASEQEIKKAFRTKAMLYHPDKNPGDKAQQQFIEICEAYEWLTNPSAQSKSKTTSQQQSPKSKEEELEERLKRAREILRRRAVEEKLRLERDFSKFKKSFIYKTAIPVYIASIIMGFTLIYDHFGTPNPEFGYISRFDAHKNRYAYEVQTPLGMKVLHVEIEDAYASQLHKGDEIELMMTPVLSSFKSFKKNNREYENLYSLHFLFWILTLIFLAPIVSIFYQKPTTESYLLMHINYFLPIILMFASLFS